MNEMAAALQSINVVTLDDVTGGSPAMTPMTPDQFTLYAASQGITPTRQLYQRILRSDGLNGPIPKL